MRIFTFISTILVIAILLFLVYKNMDSAEKTIDKGKNVYIRDAKKQVEKTNQLLEDQKKRIEQIKDQ